MKLLPRSEQSSNFQSAATFFTGMAAFVALLYYGRALCITLVISTILSFMLEPFVRGLMRFRLPRSVAAFLVCVVAILLLYLTAAAVYDQLSSLAEELPAYSQRINDIVDNVAERLERTEQNAYRLIVPKRFQDPSRLQQEPPVQPKRRRKTDPPPPPVTPAVQEVHIRQDRSSLFNAAYAYAMSFYNVLLMMSFVPFLVYFLLSWRDRMRIRYLSMFHGPDRVSADRAWEKIAGIARAYVVGNFILGLLLSAVSSFIFWTWHLPYFLLVGFFSGFLSLIPYVGFPLAVLPPFAAALVTYSNFAPYLIISGLVGVLHVLALNLLYPAIVGARVHLNPLAVTVALMFWGTLWGGLGLVLAIPLTAGVKAIFDSIEGLKPWGALLGD